MKKIFVFAIVALVAGGFVAVHLKGKSQSEEPQPTPVTTKILNESIVNEEIEELRGLDRKVEAFMRKWQIKGASLSIMRHDSLLYCKGYGWADKNVRMQPGNILRIASVSKLVTATGIMVLRDRGLISLNDKVFGEDGILCDSLYSSMIADRHCYDITVEHLLRHQAGFSRDPLFSSNDVRCQLKLDHAPEADDFFRVTLGRRLRFAPGTSQRYSNVGYLLLSRIVEKISGVSYEDFIRENVLEPAGVFDMHIAGNYYSDRRDNEVRYYTHEGDGKFVSEFNGSCNQVERCYGGNNIPLLSGAGAWTASTPELARFVASIDAEPGVQDIISQPAFEEMVEYIDSATFSLGWNDTNPLKGWSRTGTLAGTSALIKYFPDGECWIFVTNTSTWKGPGLARYTNALFEESRAKYSARLPKRDLFVD
ncbi:MAG: serine hydrolase domain-containing protein [Candidatus Cryptobacteroides sp.]